MKTRIALIVFTAMMLVAIELVLIAEEFYYIAAAFVICVLLIVHRELWSLIKTRKLPPFDERIRDTVARSLRNSFVFLVFAIALLMLTMPMFPRSFFPETYQVYWSSRNSSGQFEQINVSRSMARYLGYLLLSGGAAYMLSYVYYDRLQQKIGLRGVKAIKIVLVTSGVLIAVYMLIWLLMGGLISLIAG